MKKNVFRFPHTPFCVFIPSLFSLAISFLWLSGLPSPLWVQPHQWPEARGIISLVGDNQSKAAPDPSLEFCMIFGTPSLYDQVLYGKTLKSSLELLEMLKHSIFEMGPSCGSIVRWEQSVPHLGAAALGSSRHLIPGQGCWVLLFLLLTLSPWGWPWTASSLWATIFSCELTDLTEKKNMFQLPSQSPIIGSGCLDHCVDKHSECPGSILSLSSVAVALYHND